MLLVTNDRLSFCMSLSSIMDHMQWTVISLLPRSPVQVTVWCGSKFNELHKLQKRSSMTTALPRHNKVMQFRTSSGAHSFASVYQLQYVVPGPGLIHCIITLLHHNFFFCTVINNFIFASWCHKALTTRQWTNLLLGLTCWLSAHGTATIYCWSELCSVYWWFSVMLFPVTPSNRLAVPSAQRYISALNVICGIHTIWIL